MKIAFKESFLKDVKALKNNTLRKRVRAAIEQIEHAAQLSDIRNLKKLRGEDTFYGIRVGDYRLGVTLQKDTIIFIRCLHRRDIYRYIP